MIKIAYTTWKLGGGIAGMGKEATRGPTVGLLTALQGHAGGAPKEAHVFGGIVATGLERAEFRPLLLRVIQD